VNTFSGIRPLRDYFLGHSSPHACVIELKEYVDMPPKKKPRLSARTALADDKSSATTPARGEIGEKPDPDYDLINDPWTDEQETSLLKGVIRWKPAGLSSKKSHFHLAC
jgi:hypothetical protein